MCRHSKGEEENTLGTVKYINFSRYYFQYILFSIYISIYKYIFININNIYQFMISMLLPTVLCEDR